MPIYVLARMLIKATAWRTSYVHCPRSNAPSYITFSSSSVTHYHACHRSVFDFLHPFYGWSLRVICRRWHAFLTSAQPVQAQLARFEAHGHLYSALVSEARRDERSRIRHVQALRLGRPFRFSEIKDELAITPSLTTKANAVQEYCLCQAHVAYLRGIAHQSNTIPLYNIKD